MFAVLVEVDRGDADPTAAIEHVRQNVVPMVREAGARAAYWLDSADRSRRVAIMVFDSEEAARAQADGIKVGETPPGAPDGVTIRTVEVSEVIASI